MNIHVTQFYIEGGADFDFTHHFQNYISSEMSSVLKPSPTFNERFGKNSEITFVMSAKKSINENEIRGPTVFSEDKDVEYTVFLPFEAIAVQVDVYRSVLVYLFQAIYYVLEQLDIETSELRNRECSIIDHICNDQKMYESL